MFGELIPVGGGDPIPLLKKQLRVGRRENCDIVLRFANVSAYHCLMQVEEGYWFVRDLNSQNGIKVNGTRITPGLRKRLDPGDILFIAKHRYEVRYAPADLGAMGPPPQDDVTTEGLLSQSLMERAGLQRRPGNKPDSTPRPDVGQRYNVNDDSAGQLDRRRRRQD